MMNTPELTYPSDQVADGRPPPLSRRSIAARVALSVFAAMLALSTSGIAQIISLGAAGDFAVLGGTTVTNTGATTISGSVGVSPGTAITGFPPGVITGGGSLHSNDAPAAQAQADAFAAYTTLSLEAPTMDLTGQVLGSGLTLSPGIYHFDTTAPLVGTLSLDFGANPNAVFHFQIGTSLVAANNSAVLLLNGNSNNVFWQVGSSATLGTNVAFAGTIIANTSITLNTGATLDGRALALNGAVTLDTNLAAALVVPAANGSFWNGGQNKLWSGVNWSPDVSGATFSTLAPLADVVFSVTGVVPQNQDTVLDADTSISSLTVNDPVAVSIAGPGLLSIVGTGAATGITINSGAGLTTINSNLDLSGPAQAMTVNNVAGLVVNGVVSGSIGLTKAGPGSLTLAGANTYLGPTVVQQGALLADAANVIPTTSAVSVQSGALFNLVGFKQSIGSLAGPGAVSLGSAQLVTGNDNTDTLYSGVISGSGAVQKVGTGVWVLSGENTFSGTTNIRAGTVQAAAANVISTASAVSLQSGALFNLAGFNQSIGSLAGAGAVELGNAKLITGNDGTNTLYSGVISGSGSVEKVSVGTWELTGRNTFTGLTTVRAGTLAVTGSVAGNTLVAGGTLRGTGTVGGNVVNQARVQPGGATSPGKLTIGGSYRQSSSGALSIRLASTTNYDRLTIRGATSLGGVLNVSYLNVFNAELGDKFTIVTANGGVSGKFATFNDAHATDTLLTLQVVYEPKSVVLQFAQGSFADLTSDFTLTPNEINVAQALDQLAGDQPDSKLIQKLDALPLAQLPGALSLLSTEDFAAIFTSGLAISQVQIGNLERRLAEARRGASESSGDSHGAQNFEGKTVLSLDGKSSVEGKSSKEIVDASVESDQRWGLFISGTGVIGDLESTSDARGSSFMTGGVTFGGDYRVNRHLVVGAALGYANTSADLSRGGSLDIDSGKGSLYATLYDGGFYLNGIVGGGYGSIDTKRQTFGGMARGKTNATDFNGLLGTGYDIHHGAFTWGPVASVQYSTVGIDGFTERGALGAMRINGQSQDSLKSAVGIKAAYSRRVGRIVLTPEIRAQWQHEYLDDRSGIGAGLSSRNSFTVYGPKIGRDSLLLDAGISAQLSPHVAIFTFYTGELGRENYTVHSINGGVRVGF